MRKTIIMLLVLTFVTVSAYAQTYVPVRYDKNVESPKTTVWSWTYTCPYEATVMPSPVLALPPLVSPIPQPVMFYDRPICSVFGVVIGVVSCPFRLVDGLLFN
jgi:hypothetical protein